MRKIETAFYSGLILGAYLLSGCKPKDSNIPVSLGEGPEKTATPPPALPVLSPEKRIKSEETNPMWEATVEGFTVKVIDERKTKTPLGEYPDAPKIAVALNREIPNITSWLKREVPQGDSTFKIVLVDQLSDEGVRAYAAASIAPNRLEINPAHNEIRKWELSKILAHELGHVWESATLGSTTEDGADENASRFRGLTTKTALPPPPLQTKPASSCFIHESKYGQTLQEILAIYGERLEVERMFYKGKPNTADPTTRLGEGWQITLCPK